jgi:hypothetical protein
MITAATKPRKRMRLAGGAVLIPNSDYEAWHTRASVTPGLNDVERKVLGAIRDWYRRLYVEKFEGSLLPQRMARHLDVDPVQVRWAVERLLGLGLIAVKPGASGRANLYRPCLPRLIATSMAGWVVEDEAARPF